MNCSRWRCRTYHWLILVVCAIFVLYEYSTFLSTLKVKKNRPQHNDQASLTFQTRNRLPNVHVADVAHEIQAAPSSSSSPSTTSKSEQVVTVATRGPPNDPPVVQDRVTDNYESLLKLRDLVGTLNEKETIFNADLYPPLGTDGLVMIVQVHKRTEYLKMLIESLSNVRGIENVLLVFSFDYYDKQLLAVVEKITFCKVVEIFYPKSIQLYPDEFPGQSHDDCPRDIGKSRAMQQKCANAAHPDSYGHYREAPVTAIKHHWWWKINHVFDGMKATTNYPGYIIFLEEDLYAAPDIVSVTHQLIALKDKQCPQCDLLGLGLDQMAGNFRSSSNQVNMGSWRNNLAYAISRESWNHIRKCSKEFCTFDDYNWDWTLQSLGANCYHRTLNALLLQAPRVYHMGTCGTHQRNHGAANCNWNEGVVRVKGYINANQDNYFPAELSLSQGARGSQSRTRGFGGWGDPRDHELCLSFVHDR